MSRPRCNACDQDQPCTSWALAEDDDGSPYWTRCPGPQGRITIGRSATNDRHADGGHG